MDAQLLQAWLTTMEAAHLRLTHYQRKEGLNILLAGMAQFFSTSVNCLLSDKEEVKQTAATAVQVMMGVVIE